MRETDYLVWMTLASNFNSRVVFDALERLTPREVFEADKETLTALGVKESYAEKLCQKELMERAVRAVDVCQRRGIKIVSARCPDYPESLHRLKDKPFILYVRGDIGCLKGNKSAALIGTRRMSAVGREWGERIADTLLDGGHVLVSGGAEGIDAIASKRSLERNSPSVIVLGVDIDKYFPSINRTLIDKVAGCGAVISEYPPGTNARFFATRNRIIVGLSDSVTVVEAPEVSGALIGARLALKLDIPVYALPLGGTSFAGCRALIAEGALSIDTPDAIPEEPIAEPPKREAKMPPPKEKQTPVLDGVRLYIWERLKEGAQSENSLVSSEYGIVEILTALTELELDGIIKAVAGGKYILK